MWRPLTALLVVVATSCSTTAGRDAGAPDASLYDPRYAIVSPRDAGEIQDTNLPWKWHMVAPVLAIPPSDGGISVRWVPIDPPATDRAWAGGVLLWDGGVVAIPFNEPSVLMIHPADDTFERWPVHGGGVSEGWEGGVLLPDGTVIGIPRNASRFLKIDPAAGTATPFGDDVSDASDGGVDKFRGGVLGLNGLVYATPSSATYVARLDPATGAVTRLPIPPPGLPVRANGAVLFPTGDIAMLPGLDPPGLLIVPSRTGGTDQVWYLLRPPNPPLPGYTGGGLITGIATAVAAPQQNALLLRYELGQIGWGAAVPGVAEPAANSYLFGAWSTDGHCYVPPFGADRVLRLDVAADRPEMLEGGVTVFGSVLGAVGLPDGRIIGIPHLRSSWLELTPDGRRAMPIEAMTSPYFNKL